MAQNMERKIGNKRQEMKNEERKTEKVDPNLGNKEQQKTEKLDGRTRNRKRTSWNEVRETGKGKRKRETENGERGSGLGNRPQRRK